MKDIKTLVFRLLLITAFAGFVLAVGNKLTAPVIAEKKAEKLNLALKEVFEEADDFKKDDSKETADLLAKGDIVQEVFIANKGQEKVGYVFRVLAKGGFGGKIELILGVNNEGMTTGFKVLTHNETPGFGSHSQDPEFVEGVKGNSIKNDLTASLNPSTDSDIMAISGATITTNCILGGLNETAKIALEILAK